VEDRTIELTDEQRELYRATARSLKGHERRVFMARVVKMLGKGGQSQAKRELGWDRDTIRKGMHELDSGMAWLDAYSARGRKRAEERLPRLLEDIQAIVDGQSQTDPSFKSTRLYTRLSAAAVRQALITQKGYTERELPSEETIRVKLNDLGYTLRSVKKSQPQKK
jgi:Rhodopirellula transposase DDE domain